LLGAQFSLDYFVAVASVVGEEPISRTTAKGTAAFF
jgi:hypothetical protein